MTGIAPLGGGDSAEVVDDTIHLRWPMESRTLCDQDADARNCRFIGDPWPDGWAGCWTCLKVAKEQAAR
jgi:hypothetical protein